MQRLPQHGNDSLFALFHTPFMERTRCSGRTVVVNVRGGPAAGPSENGRRLDRKGGRVVRWAHRGPGLLGCWTVALPQEVPPAGVSFLSESLSMPEKG